MSGAGALVRDALFWAMAAGAVAAAWRVFRTDSMVRAAYWLMASFVAVGVILVLLGAEFLGLVLLLMMAGEMTIMAVFMVMFMMNPAGLNPMTMVHQHRASIVGGVVAFLGLAAVGVLGEFPAAPPPDRAQATAQLGEELLGDSMLVFETAGVTLLATMIGAIAIASRKGRFGVADQGSAEPEVAGGAQPGEVAAAAAAAATAATAAGVPGSSAPETAEDEHAGHSMSGPDVAAAGARSDPRRTSDPAGAAAGPERSAGDASDAGDRGTDGPPERGAR